MYAMVSSKVTSQSDIKEHLSAESSMRCTTSLHPVTNVNTDSPDFDSPASGGLQLQLPNEYQGS